MDLREPLQSETVADVGYRPLVSIGTDGTAAEAVALMKLEKCGCVVVMSEGRMRGIFTERDLLKRVLHPGLGLDTPIVGLMSDDVTVARVDEPIHEVLARMYIGRLRHLPVLDGDEPVGTISIKRAIHFLADQLPQAILNLPPDPETFPATREGS